MTSEDRHGTVGGYTNHGCRCNKCRAAMSAYHRQNRYGREGAEAEVDRSDLADLLAELFPYGLTNDCPVRQRKAAA